MRTLLLTGLLLSSAGAMHADEASHRAKVEQLLELMDMQKLLDSSQGAIEQSMQQAFQKMGGTPEQEPILAEYSAKMAEVYSSAISWERLKEPMIDIYIDFYSEEDMDAVIAFYESPVGRKTVSGMPQLMQRSMAISQEMVQEIIPDIMRLTREMGKKIREAKSEEQ